MFKHHGLKRQLLQSGMGPVKSVAHSSEHFKVWRTPKRPVTYKHRISKQQTKTQKTHPKPQPQAEVPVCCRFCGGAQPAFRLLEFCCHPVASRAGVTRRSQQVPAPPTRAAAEVTENQLVGFPWFLARDAVTCCLLCVVCCYQSWFDFCLMNLRDK